MSQVFSSVKMRRIIILYHCVVLVNSKLCSRSGSLECCSGFVWNRIENRCIQEVTNSITILSATNSPQSNAVTYTKGGLANENATTLPMNLSLGNTAAHKKELNACSDLEGRTNMRNEGLVAASVSLTAISCLFLVLYVRLHFYVTKSQPESLTAIIHTV
uniref:Uncharacterized protein LOC111105482 isoform X1 n=1 Tax=Crassostrea virginica TaxID=6565 RepID=A0A8B8AWG0_CRAVI|nr:uncharacterized protein LOC111105482 isoform X1 [Crassostrea virginica]